MGDVVKEADPDPGGWLQEAFDAELVIVINTAKKLGWTKQMLRDAVVARWNDVLD